LVFAAGSAFAQMPGSIGVFSDPGGTNCDIYDFAPGLITVYVVHVNSTGATAAQFRVDNVSWGAGTLTFLGEISAYPTVIGNSQSGISIGYGACIVSPNLLLTINYFGSGLTPPCSYIKVVPDPQAIPPGNVLVVDCGIPAAKWTATGGAMVVNPLESCLCDIPVQETTWGRVKSLYQ
jgi:hypothetical protein